jgi:hypothetical protein
MTQTPDRDPSDVVGDDDGKRIVREAEVIYAGGEDRPPEEEELSVPEPGREGSVVDRMKTSGIVGVGCLAAVLMAVMVVVTALIVGIPLAIARTLKGSGREE